MKYICVPLYQHTRHNTKHTKNRFGSSILPISNFGNHWTRRLTGCCGKCKGEKWTWLREKKRYKCRKGIPEEGHLTWDFKMRRSSGKENRGEGILYQGRQLVQRHRGKTEHSVIRSVIYKRGIEEDETGHCDWNQTLKGLKCQIKSEIYL